jgi:cathepsin L
MRAFAWWTVASLWVALCCVAWPRRAAAEVAPLGEADLDARFAEWALEHSRAYETRDELLRRRAVWRDNFERIQTHNGAGKTWRLAMNQFGDRTASEFRKLHGYVPANGTLWGAMKRHPRSRLRTRGKATGDAPPAPLPDSVNWVTAGRVTRVKNQGDCGACWAFSATGAVEGAWAARHGLTELSEQHLVDCVSTNEGCAGGSMQNAFTWMIEHGGDCSEADCPYRGAAGNCPAASCPAAARVSAFVSVDNSEQALMEAVAQGPVSAAVDAANPDWQFYAGGIINDPGCFKQLTHGVLVVGYGQTEGIDFFLVKNSWDVTWGMGGYAMLARNTGIPNGQCGVAMDAVYPISA